MIEEIFNNTLVQILAVLETVVVDLTTFREDLRQLEQRSINYPQDVQLMSSEWPFLL